MIEEERKSRFSWQEYDIVIIPSPSSAKTAMDELVDDQEGAGWVNVDEEDDD